MNHLATDSINHIKRMEERARTVKTGEPLSQVTLERADLIKLIKIAQFGLPPDVTVAGIDNEDPLMSGHSFSHGEKRGRKPVIPVQAARYVWLRKHVGTGITLRSGNLDVVTFHAFEFVEELRPELERQFDLDIDEAMQRDLKGDAA